MYVYAVSDISKYNTLPFMLTFTVIIFVVAYLVLEMDTGDGHVPTCACLVGGISCIPDRKPPVLIKIILKTITAATPGRRSTIVDLAANGLYSSYTKIKGLKGVINERKNTAGSCGAGGGTHACQVFLRTLVTFIIISSLIKIYYELIILS